MYTEKWLSCECTKHNTNVKYDAMWDLLTQHQCIQSSDLSQAICMLACSQSLTQQQKPYSTRQTSYCTQDLNIMTMEFWNFLHRLRRSVEPGLFSILSYIPSLTPHTTSFNWKVVLLTQIQVTWSINMTHYLRCWIKEVTFCEIWDFHSSDDHDDLKGFTALIPSPSWESE
jgi:hypothetical protein